ncbi:hypothetical protein IDJ77_03730 [Mucilaginibacter sp. ZT4R22]|uniref:Uncharacterized protein n=1 Tax=Mucilaginibacter pankratovii TaxID=2772110 RepID=A0ABR7WKQ8_9SPHI|nr:hypothetical protein [Mucilaginibacter pankratovii]MBD1362910.1 hypothetical protein [Mucilaginibacter pankratovii]
MSAILAAIYFVVNWYKNKQKRYRQLLNGQWANFDAIGAPSQTHYFNLSLHADKEDGTVIGTLEITEFGNDNSALFSLNGDMRYKSVKLTTTVVRHGEAHHYDIVKVKVLIKGICH